MNITAKDGTRLVGVSSPAAGVAEVHEMKMEGDVMKMRAVPVLDLPAGQTVQHCFNRAEIENFARSVPQTGGLGSCAPSVQESGNRATWTLDCPSPQKLSGSGEVSYSGNSFTAVSKLSVDLQGQKMDISQRVSGRRIGDCRK